MPDSGLERLGMGMRAAREAAKRWVEASGTRDITASLAEKDARIDALELQLANLLEALKADAEEPRR
ncbi:MAG: hypothetical protein ACO21B_04150, partial [Gemmobacter sp.]